MIIICICNNIYRKKMRSKINKYIFNIIKEVHLKDKYKFK